MTQDLSGFGLLVSGAAGFLGRRVVAACAARGATVTPMDVAPCPSGVRGDASDLTSARAAVQTLIGSGRRKLAVIHLAGMARRERCVADPEGAFIANTRATWCMLEACRAAHVQRFLMPSTALVYGVGHKGPVSEDAPLVPASVYESTKCAAEYLVQGHCAAFGMSADILRLANVYGPGANPESVTGTALAQAMAGGPVRLRSLSPVRDFVYVNDVVEAFIRLLLAGDEPGFRVFNIGSGIGTSVRDLALLACAAARVEPVVEEIGPPTSGDTLVLSCERLRARTGWVPATPLAQGLAATIEAMRSVEAA